MEEEKLARYWLQIIKNKRTSITLNTSSFIYKFKKFKGISLK